MAKRSNGWSLTQAMAASLVLLGPATEGAAKDNAPYAAQHLAQIDTTDATPAGQAVMQAADAPATSEAEMSPGEAGGVCISVASDEQAAGALITITPHFRSVRVVPTAAPGEYPAGPADLNCMTADEFHAGHSERVAAFVTQTADYMESLAAKLGVHDLKQIREMRNSELIRNTETAITYTSQAFNALNRSIFRAAGPEIHQAIKDQATEDQLVATFRTLRAEQRLFNQMLSALPAVERGLNDGSLSPVDPDAPVDLPDISPSFVKLESGPDSARAVTLRQSASNDTHAMPAHQQQRLERRLSA